MKQLMCFLLSLILVHGQLLCEESSVNIPELTHADHKALKQLYLLDKKSFLKTENMDDACLNYYFCTVYDHTRILEHKINIKKNGWSSASFKVGLFFATIGGISMGYLMLRNGLSPVDKFFLGLLSSYLPLSLLFFYKAAYYQQRLSKRLKRNKRIFNLLQAEWLIRDSSSN